MIGRRIKHARQREKLSRAELARLLDIDVSVMGRIERDDVNLSADRLVLIARLLRTTAAELLGEAATPKTAAAG